MKGNNKKAGLFKTGFFKILTEPTTQSPGGLATVTMRFAESDNGRHFISDATKWATGGGSYGDYNFGN